MQAYFLRTFTQLPSQALFLQLLSPLMHVLVGLASQHLPKVQVENLGPVHMGRSYLGCRGNISTGQIMLFCSYGEMFSRLPGKFSRCDVDFVKCKHSESFPAKRESCVNMG